MGKDIDSEGNVKDLGVFINGKLESGDPLKNCISK